MSKALPHGYNIFKDNGTEAGLCPVSENNPLVIRMVVGEGGAWHPPLDADLLKSWACHPFHIRTESALSALTQLLQTPLGSCKYSTSKRPGLHTTRID